MVLSSVHAIQKKLPQALPVASHQVLQTDMCVCVCTHAEQETDVTNPRSSVAAQASGILTRD